MLLTVAKPVKIVGRNNRLWYLEALMLPVATGETVGIYLQGPPVRGKHHFAEIKGFFYAFDAVTTGLNSSKETSRVKPF